MVCVASQTVFSIVTTVWVPPVPFKIIQLHPGACRCVSQAHDNFSCCVTYTIFPNILALIWFPPLSLQNQPTPLLKALLLMALLLHCWPSPANGLPCHTAAASLHAVTDTAGATLPKSPVASKGHNLLARVLD